MHENVRVVSDDIRKSLGQLYIETDYARRAVYRKLFLSELKRVGGTESRLQTLRSCLSDCGGHIVRHRRLIAEQRSIGVDVRPAEIQLDKVLDVQVTLRIELRRALRALEP